MNSKPAELRSMAAKSLCIRVVYEWASQETLETDDWRDEDGYGTCEDHDWFIWQMLEMQVPESMIIPNMIRDQIECHITSILNEVADWIRYHHRLRFFHDEAANLPDADFFLKKYLLELAWRPDQSIDYTATARNVLAGSNFSTLEKYRFACTYCFTQEIQRFRILGGMTKSYCFERDPFMVYWGKWLYNELHTITVPVYVSIDVVMFGEAMKHHNVWLPMKFFFEKLNSGGKIWQCGNALTLEATKKYQKELLAMLSDSEKALVYQDHMKVIIENYLKSGNLEAIRQISSELKVNANFQHFIVIIKRLVLFSMENSRNFNEITPLFFEIWNDVNDVEKNYNYTGLRSRIAENCARLIGDRCSRFDFNSRRQYRDPLVFIRAFAAAHNPNHFLQSNFYWLVIWQPFASIVGLINEFQLSVEDVERLKMITREPSKIEYACLIYLRYGKFREFNRFISFCYSNDDGNRIAFQKNLLNTDDGLDALGDALDRVKWRTIYDFICHVYHDSRDFASICTTQVMLRALKDETSSFLKHMMHRCEAKSIIRCIKTFVSAGDNLSEAKLACIDLINKYIYSHKDFVFKGGQFHEILEWCYGYGRAQGFDDFFDALDVERCAVLVTQLENCFDEYTFRVTDSFQEFFYWISSGFEHEWERSELKLEMIDVDCWYLEHTIKFLRQRRYRRCLLNWFFDSDADKITEFLAKLRECYL
ncbi:uncharacterized protein LOC135849010 isoform X2 [Planococcus citri]|uniref:uncharacterized protein LOC135849010 isoform X2 n=1 Tax=Planococcus citri TaxID=170843 RepID=UPI0031F8916C